MSEAGGLSTLDEEVTDTSLPTTSVSSHARRRACYTFHDLVPRDVAVAIWFQSGAVHSLFELSRTDNVPYLANRCVRLRSSSRYRSIKASIPSKLKKLEDGWLDWKDDLVSSAKYWRVQRVHSTTMLAAGLNGTRPSYYKRMHHQLLPAA
ncbi:hypothetical protein PC114_g17864 [Phytophthora cactorum]|uniref:Uncharacterized protein n=1 Tax=Phytophthora cactorum TaxID=29920 RepID=A0A8T1BFD3_9STRA|nr:hypothetical protein PC114_g17864 [Phytophthora cactorum]KAG2902537.1 hypothetical protein PC115_g15559 [Phytophthora cactorum]KAG3070409.1 hypothetical protein PC122_g16152 [Phytophthora cactorum]